MPAGADPADSEVTKVQRMLLSPSTVSAELPLMVGEVVQGRYELMRYLGSGGIGIVVAARHRGFDEPVALKFLRPSCCTDAEAVSRFTAEARANFKLRSEHVARVFDVDTHRDTHFIAMEWLEGTSLRELQRQGVRFAPEVAVDYVLQVCEALSAAHALGIVHRDIKPENLFVTGEPASAHIRVLDFGISKIALEEAPRDSAQQHAALGTPPYMAPEQIRGARDLDGRADLFAVGCVLYELLAGKPPFERESLAGSCAAVLEHEPAPLHTLRPDVSPELWEVVRRCLAKSVHDRWQDSAALARALAPFGSGRYVTYPGRCQKHLDGERTHRWSTPPRVSGTHLVPRELAADSGASGISETDLTVSAMHSHTRLAWWTAAIAGTAAALLAMWWLMRPAPIPTLTELRPREITQPALNLDLELPPSAPDEPAAAAELPQGQRYEDLPRTRRRRAAAVDVEVKPQAKATLPPTGSSTTAIDEEPDVGF